MRWGSGVLQEFSRALETIAPAVDCGSGGSQTGVFQSREAPRESPPHLSRPAPLKLSIVTAVRNMADTIGDTLRSVASQSHSDIEHIVVDGLSTDGTLDVVARFPHVARIISESDRGLYDAMNKGARAATGEYVSWLNADDMLSDPTALEKVVKAAERRPAVVAASVDMVDPVDTQKVNRRYSVRGFNPRWLRYGYAVPHPGFHIRRDVLERLGGFDLQFPLAADFDLIARAIHGEQESYVLLDEVVVRMRMGGHSYGLRSMLRMLEEVHASCRKNNIPTNRALMLYRYVHKALQYVQKPTQGSTVAA